VNPSLHLHPQNSERRERERERPERAAATRWAGDAMARALVAGFVNGACTDHEDASM
jgi:hypothetical protein